MERVSAAGVVSSIRPFATVLASSMTVGEQFAIRLDGRLRAQVFRIFYEPSVTGGAFVITDRAGVKVADHTLGHEDIAFCTWILMQERIVQQGRTSVRSADIRILRHPAVNVTPLDFGQMPRLLTHREFQQASQGFVPQSAVYQQITSRYATEDEYQEMEELLARLPEPEDIAGRLKRSSLRGLGHDFTAANVASALRPGAATTARLDRANFIHPADMHMFAGETVGVVGAATALGLLLAT